MTRYPFQRSNDIPAACSLSARSLRSRGVTLLELLIALSITAMLSVVLGGLVMAVQTAREHSEGVEEATMQAQVALDRMAWMVSHAGTYRYGGPSTMGLAVVASTSASGVEHPDVLVVWSGGRHGGMAAAGPQDRLPRIDELVLYAPDMGEPGRLVELTQPADPKDIDFRGSGFADTIRALVRSPQAVQVLLCDRVRPGDLEGYMGMGGARVGNVRFELVQSPEDSELAATAPGSAEWYALPWAQGIASGDSGLRQANVRIELQVATRRLRENEQGDLPAVPFFGSASQRYAYHQ